MRKIYSTPTGELIVCVSIFSGMDLFLLGMIRAGAIPGYACEWNFHACNLHITNYKHPDGTPVVEPFIAIPREEYDALRADEDTKDTVGIVDGQYVRTKKIQEVNGHDIRHAIEARYGKHIRIILIGGPPCPLYSNLSKRGRQGMAKHDANEKNSRELIFQYLRILEELKPDAAVMEEVPQLKAKKFKKIYDSFIKKALSLPYNFADKELCALHYQGNQMRWRDFMLFIDKRYSMQPVFPEADTVNVKYVKDFLDIDKFFSGHFVDSWKTKNHFMCTVTSGSLEFKKNGTIYTPSIDELLLCFDVQKGRYIIPQGIPQQQLRKALGNAVCESVAYALGKTIIEKMFRLKPDGNGYWIPINAPGSDNTPDNTVARSSDTSQNDEQETTIATANGPDADVTVDCEAVSNLPAIIAPENILSHIDNYTNETSEPIGLPVSLPATTSNPADAKPVKFYENGFEIWRGKSMINGDKVVAILTLHSDNRKTGDMGQLYFLTADISPTEAVRTGKDEAICGSCPLSHYKDGYCYVYIEQDPRAIWEAWRNDAYPKLRPDQFRILNGLSVRLGAYGDPAVMPLNVLTELKKYVVNHVGYTHQWQEESKAGLKSQCMASVETIAQQQKAAEMGWRTYRIIKPEDTLLPGEILCPNITHEVQCKDCQLCRGTSRPAKNIAVHVHGTRKNRFNSTSSVVETESVKPITGLRNVCNTDTSFRKVLAPKIISSAVLEQMQFRSLNFDGRWNEFFGFPAIDFHCIIHGLSGHGKSTFAIQLAKYLADNFGKVIYISGEEGFAMTFKDKFISNQAISSSIDVADLRTYDEIMRELPAGAYNFIFIDSLDTMKIDAGKLKKIKEKHIDSAMITISQSTKGGLIRGSYEIVHDSDITVKVTDGIAETTKNRFKEKGMEFEVFVQQDQVV